MGSWPDAKLDDLFTYRSGLSKPRSAFGSGFPFLSFRDVFYNFFVPAELSELVNATEHERDSCSIRRGDVFLTRTSETLDELGMSCVALRDYPNATFNGFCKRLRPRPGTEILPEFAGYAFRGPGFRRQVTAMSSLSTRASLNESMLSRLALPLPPLAVQARIASVLKALDDKIDLNRETNRTLEAMAQAIFRSWFVDFVPVVAKSEGREPFGMDAETAALFPDSFADSELGPIPEGWDVSEIGKEVEAVGGSTPSTKVAGYWEGGTIPWTTPRDLSAHTGAPLFATARQITEAGLAKISSGLLPMGTVLLSSRAPVGYTAIAAVPMAVNQGYIAMRCHGRVGTHYCYWWTRENIPEIESRAGGTTFAEISKKAFRPIPVLVPGPAILSRWEKVAAPLYELVLANLWESQTLADLRDLLLPKLLSGEVRVPEAEEKVEDVA